MARVNNPADNEELDTDWDKRWDHEDIHDVDDLSDVEDDEDDDFDHADEDQAVWDEAGATDKPRDYYFKVVCDPGNINPIMILITPKSFWDANQYTWDQHVSQDAGGPLGLPGYEELAEGTFAPEAETASAASVERDLIQRGLILNPKLCY